jgi:hypothetical protein
MLLGICTWACFEEDKRVPPYPGEVYVISDAVQHHSSFFDLEKGAVVDVLPSDTWQLAFECSESGWHILTNSGDQYFLFNTGTPDMPDPVIMPAGIEGLFDKPACFPDSTAAGNWVTPLLSGNQYTLNHYLLARFTDGQFGIPIRLNFVHVDAQGYRFYYEDMHTMQSDTVEIAKVDSLNFVYYAFPGKPGLFSEPGKDKYDLVFTSYYDEPTLMNITMPYKVGGVLLNAYNTWAALDSAQAYHDIDASRLPEYTFSKQRDVPGYSWKTFSGDISQGGRVNYLVQNGWTYIIKTSEGNFFKLRFLSYMVNGYPGFPQFEYEKLN